MIEQTVSHCFPLFPETPSQNCFPLFPYYVGGNSLGNTSVMTGKRTGRSGISSRSAAIWTARRTQPGRPLVLQPGVGQTIMEGQMIGKHQPHIPNSSLCDRYRGGFRAGGNSVGK
jgi:hypothetical protein